MKSALQVTKWVLRIAVCMIFAGHGGIALIGNDAWIPYLTFWGLDTESAVALLPYIGVADLIVAIGCVVFDR